MKIRKNVKVSDTIYDSLSLSDILQTSMNVGEEILAPTTKTASTLLDPLSACPKLATKATNSIMKVENVKISMNVKNQEFVIDF